ncbi:MAG: SURF1 family protein [Nitrosomonadales bacterium]
MKEKTYKNILSLIFAIAFFSFIRLGFWQLERAEQKNIINENYLQRQIANPLDSLPMGNEDILWRKINLQGEFLDINIFLDNQSLNRNPGYLVYSPFQLTDGRLVLVNRGWIPITKDRKQLPIVNKGTKNIITGIVVPYPAVGINLIQNNNIERIDTNNLRLQKINSNEINNMKLFDESQLYQYPISMLTPESDGLYAKIQLPVSDSEKNYGYAFQWFAFAITLLIIFIVLRKRKRV